MHEHEWRFAPNIEKVSPARTNTYGFDCAGSGCDEYILLSEIERRLNAHESLRTVARAAQHFAARGYERPCYEWRTPVLEALDALPAWVLKEGHDR